MKRIAIFTDHYLGSRRKAGVHWIADACWRAGWEVVMVTTTISPISRMRRDQRLQYGLMGVRNQLKWHQPRLGSYVWYTWWHPAHLRNKWLNAVTASLFRHYGTLPLGDLEPYIRTTDTIVFESAPGLLLFGQCRQLNPTSRFVYRASDDLKFLLTHPSVLNAESEYLPQFDLVSVPSAYQFEALRHHPNVVLHPHGIRKDLFDRPCESPYPPDSMNIVFVGNSHFDYDFLQRASRLFPQVKFHVIGPIPDLPRRDNVIGYGEMPFVDTIPYVKHASVGLQIRSYEPGAESLATSLKVIQYTYCRLPIVAPEALQCRLPHVCSYKYGHDESIRQAVQGALDLDHSTISTAGILNWDEIAVLIAGNNRESSC